MLEEPLHISAQLKTLIWLPQVIMSGGQTGVDRAALDWACAHRIVHRGWCPKGRIAADGVLGGHYQLVETESAGYLQRTKFNVRDGDATLIVNTGDMNGGTLNTVEFAKTLKKPYLVVHVDKLSRDEAVGQVLNWLSHGKCSVLNVAGPREEKRPGIYAKTLALLDACLVQH
jgi:hypothetical protein